MTTANDISNRIIEAVMLLVPETLTRLSTRGIVTVSARRGWFVVEPSQDEAREAFEARRVIELGLLHQLRSVDKAAVRQLKSHLQREKAALAGAACGIHTAARPAPSCRAFPRLSRARKSA